MYILITGGAGYIGSHIAKLLYNKCKNIIILDNLSSGDVSNCKYGIFIKGDIKNIEEIEDNVFKRYVIKTVIHVAGKAFVGESFDRIEEYYNVNVIGTINILNMMVKYNINNIIFSSSCSVYGNSSVLPITENTVLNPISPYGVTKKLCEDIIISYSKTKNIKYKILRYFNVAGNDFDMEVVDNVNNFKRIIPTIILKIINNEVIQINGYDYETKDGTCVRNYIHVLDLAEAHINCIDYEENLICNIGSNDNYSIIDIVKLIERYLNMTVRFEFKNRIQGDPSIVYCNNEKAKIELKWVPKYNIDDIIISSIKLIKKIEIKSNF